MPPFKFVCPTNKIAHFVEVSLYFILSSTTINFSFFELSLPDDDPVYTLKKVMEELDFSGLLANCSDKGRTGYNPIMMYAVVTYANMRGIRSVDRIVDLCERDLAFIWLTRGQKPKRDAFYDFKNRKLTSDVLDDLNYQFMRRLQKEGLVTLKELFIDGTKIEANANRYTFVWRGSINYHLAGLLDSIDHLFEKYNSFLQENDYGTKYELGNAQMFVIEGMDKVREVIEKNRKRKLVKHKKLSNNRIIEIDNCSPLEIRKLQNNLTMIADNEGIEFVYGKGKRKPALQQLHEELEQCGKRLMEYKECFEIMGKDRNSYSKTDLEATFMRMKEDYMKNGQLKPGYNVQIATEGQYALAYDLFPNPTDTRTLKPFLDVIESSYFALPEYIVADAGYGSEENYVDIIENRQLIPLITYGMYLKEQERRYKKDAFKTANWDYDNADDYYTCPNGKKLIFKYNSQRKDKNVFARNFRVYECEDCCNCPYRSQCCKAKEGNNRKISINVKWEQQKEYIRA